jgi:DNA-binding MurR/RpiR family transcriptional regulator
MTLDNLTEAASMLVQAAEIVHAGSGGASGLGRVSVFPA